MTRFFVVVALVFSTYACGGGGSSGGPDAGAPDTVSDAGRDAEPDIDDPTGDIGKPDTPGLENAPPVLARIGDRVATVGEALTIVVEGEDPDQTPLTYSVFGTLPEGAKFIKAERRFEWTPQTAPDTVFLTFVVSDGQAFDRETVRIEVVTEKGAHEPVFTAIGDQIVTVGKAYDLTLRATDADGDTVVYGQVGDLPTGATLNDQTGVFSWVPPSTLAGKTVRVTFTASDGALTARLEVSFVVRVTGGAGPGPPVFGALAPVTAQVGTPVTVTLAATDPDGDTLTFAVYGENLDGASLSGAKYTYTAPAAAAGKAFVVTFSVTDGVYTAFASLDITVAKTTTTGNPDCKDDAGEPNESAAQATPLAIGDLAASICDTTLVPIDLDWYVLTIPAGRTLELDISFDAAAGDLDLFLLDSAEKILASSETAASAESLSWAASSETKVYVVVAGVGQESFHMAYALSAKLTEAAQCTPDASEPNDSFGAAKALPPAGSQRSICPGDIDFYSVELGCGETLVASLDTLGMADLDLGLWRSASDTAPVAQSATLASVETVSLAKIPSAGTWFLRVSGYPPGSAAGSYTLSAEHSGACAEDALGPHATAASAAPLSGAEGEHLGLRVCCAPDWFSVTAPPGDDVLVGATATGPGELTLTAFAPDGTTPLDSGGPSATTATVGATVPAGGSVLVRVQAPIGKTYDLEWLVSKGEGPPPTGCTKLSCPLYDVCDATSGECVSDFCLDAGECPGSHACLDTYCAPPCAVAADCRKALGYTCKGFSDGLHCGIAGSGAPGGACYDHVDCAAQDVCTFSAAKGYCATLGCSEGGVTCPAGTTCRPHPAGGTLCAKQCSKSSDCRVGDGYDCTEGVCLPK
ncbi:MAG: putative Ig domain-containing protein [Myxococcota bacterium]